MRSFREVLFGSTTQKGALERSGVRSMIVLVVMIVAGAIKDHKPIMPELVDNAEVLAVGFLSALGLTTTASYKLPTPQPEGMQAPRAPVDDAASSAPHA